MGKSCIFVYVELENGCDGILKRKIEFEKQKKAIPKAMARTVVNLYVEGNGEN